MSSSRRVFRIAEQIRMLVANELLQHDDPRFQLVTITSAVVSPDLGNAKVYWQVSGGEQRRAEVTEAFASAAGHFRHVVGKALGIRVSPAIRFYYDDTLDAADAVERLFQKIRTPESGSSSSDGEG